MIKARYIMIHIKLHTNVTLSISENEGKNSLYVHIYEYLTSKVNTGKQVHCIFVYCMVSYVFNLSELAFFLCTQYLTSKINAGKQVYNLILFTCTSVISMSNHYSTHTSTKHYFSSAPCVPIHRKDYCQNCVPSVTILY